MKRSSYNCSQTAKNSLLLLCSILLIAGLVACGGGSDDSPPSPSENTAPTASNMSISVDPNDSDSASGNLGGFDAEGDPLTYQIVSQCTNGVVDLTPSTGEFTYTPNAGASGSDSFTFLCNDGTLDSNTATVTINIGGGNSTSSLSGSLDSNPAQMTVDLEAEGTIYWKHWGLDAVGTITTKRSESDDSLIGNYQPYPASANLDPMHWDNCPFTFTWPDMAGSPTTSAGNTNHFISFHVWKFAINQGFELEVPADTTARTLTLYIGTSSLNADIHAELSDGGASPFNATIINTVNMPSANVVTLDFTSASAGETLTVRVTYASDNDSDPGGTLNLYAATLQ